LSGRESSRMKCSRNYCLDLQLSNHDITLTTKGIFALDEMHYAIHPGLFPIGLVDVIVFSVICNLNHSPSFVVELKIF
jgi:hypothetical protein